VILDAGFLVSIDRGERSAQEFLHGALRRNTRLNTTHPVVAQVWRDGARQARLRRFLTSVTVHPLDNGSVVGAVLARSKTTDVVDAHVVTLAILLQEPILTGDPDYLAHLVDSLPIATFRPRIHRWP
jgi:hypothetical protein